MIVSLFPVSPLGSLSPSAPSLCRCGGGGFANKSRVVHVTTQASSFRGSPYPIKLREAFVLRRGGGGVVSAPGVEPRAHEGVVHVAPAPQERGRSPAWKVDRMIHRRRAYVKQQDEERGAVGRERTHCGVICNIPRPQGSPPSCGPSAAARRRWATTPSPPSSPTSVPPPLPSIPPSFHPNDALYDPNINAHTPSRILTTQL